MRTLVAHGHGTVYFIEESAGERVCHAWSVNSGQLSRTIPDPCCHCTSSVHFEVGSDGLTFGPSSGIECGSLCGSHGFLGSKSRFASPFALQEVEPEVLSAGSARWYGSQTRCETALAQGEARMRSGAPVLDHLIDASNEYEEAGRHPKPIPTLEAFASRVTHGGPIYLLQSMRDGKTSACLEYKVRSAGAKDGVVSALVWRTIRDAAEIGLPESSGRTHRTTVSIGLSIDTRCGRAEASGFGWVAGPTPDSDVGESIGCSERIPLAEPDPAGEFGGSWYISRAACELGKRLGHPATTFGC